MEKKNILFLAIAVPVVVLDQLTKAWILATLRLHEGFPVIDGFFDIIHVRNPGAAFGFLAGVSPVFRSVFFLSVTLAAMILIIHYLRASRNDETSLVVSLALILAGAAGNLIDRIRFGEVVDFLDVYVGTHHWPAFNVADAAITTGASLLALILLGRKKDRGAAGERRKE
ncbi:MAG: signal peptidase II [Syntrophales bacterium]